jgi:hypothetical protein
VRTTSFPSLCPTLLSLTLNSILSQTPYMTANDINTGWGALLETFEMAAFALLHVKAFSYHPYRPPSPSAQRTPRLRSLMHVFDFRETGREIRAGWLYAWRRARGVEVDVRAHREAHLAGAFEHSRVDAWMEKALPAPPPPERAHKGLPTDAWPEREVGAYHANESEHAELLGAPDYDTYARRRAQIGANTEVDVEVQGERQWRVPRAQRHAASDMVGVMIERELAARDVLERERGECIIPASRVLCVFCGRCGLV